MIGRICNALIRPSRATLVRELEFIHAELQRLPQRAARVEREIKRMDLEEFTRSLPNRRKRGW